MEHQTRFNLEAALETWRRELSLQSGLTSADRRELEAHLQDSMLELQRLGLIEEEAFWLARRRIGGPRQLGEEYATENPAAAWGEKLLWIALAVLGLQVWQSVCYSLASPLVLVSLTMRNTPVWLEALRDMWYPPFGYELIYIVTALWFAVHFRRGRMNGVTSIWEFLSQSRVRFLSAAIPLVLAIGALESIGRLPFWLTPRRDLWHSVLAHDFAFSFVYTVSSSLALAFFIAWLIPVRLNIKMQFAPTG